MKKIIALALAIVCVISVEAQKLNGSWKGKADLGGAKLSIVFNFNTDAQRNRVCTMDSPDQLVKGIPTKIIFESTDSINLSVEKIGLVYSGKITNDTIIGNISQSGMKIPVTLTAGNVEYKRPQTPKKPLPYKTEEVAFENKAAAATLSGTISYPIGYKEGKKVPVVIFISGSGLQDRDETVSKHKPFFVIADYLAQHGIASLRFDDRGFGKSKGDPSKATTKDFTDDALSGIEMLKKFGKFSKVGAIGHSDGGTSCFILAGKKKVDFIVSMAGVAVKGDTSLTAQYNKTCELMGAKINFTVEQYRKHVSSVKSEWLNYILDYDPSADIQASVCPIMAINGDKDVQVISTLNLKGVKDNAKKNKKNLIKEYPGLNHLFQHCTTGLPQEYIDIEETTSPEVLSDIANWINSLK